MVLDERSSVRPEVEDLLGYRVFAGGVDACLTAIERAITSGTQCRWLACLNPHSYSVAARTPDFAQALNAADWLIPDGVGIVLASRLNGGNIKTRLCGPDVFVRLHRRLNDLGRHRVFFLGSSQQVLSAIKARLQLECPNIEVVGTHAPPFRSTFSWQESAAMVDAVNSVSPDVLWVGMTSPKQDIWLHENACRLHVRFAGAVGAAFDYYSGRVQRAHPMMCAAGLEWFPRLMRSPRRLWRRTFVSAPVFIGHVVRDRFRKRRS